MTQAKCDSIPALAPKVKNHLPDASVYSRLAQLFLELRGKGLTLSAADMLILQSWQLRTLCPEVIADVMLQMADDCTSQKKGYPLTLEPVARRLEQVLKKRHEF